MMSLRDAWGARRAAARRYRRRPCAETLSALDVRDAAWRGAALRHAARLRPWAIYPVETIPERAHPLVRAYFSGTSDRRAATSAAQTPRACCAARAMPRSPDREG